MAVNSLSLPLAAASRRSRRARPTWRLHCHADVAYVVRTMTVTPFKPQFMKVGVLTAALQELTPREKRDPDPDLAIEEWLAFAQELGANYIQLSAALHPTETDIPPEAMLDPVANTLDLRQPFN